MSAMEGSAWQTARENEVNCRGSYSLGTACGLCPKCKRELAKMNTPKFKIKNEQLGDDVIANFRVRPEVHAKIKELAKNNDLSMSDIVRQMIDFALEHS